MRCPPTDRSSALPPICPFIRLRCRGINTCHLRYFELQIWRSYAAQVISSPYSLLNLFLWSQIVVIIRFMCIWITQLRHFRPFDLELVATDCSRPEPYIHWFLQQTSNWTVQASIDLLLWWTHSTLAIYEEANTNSFIHSCQFHIDFSDTIQSSVNTLYRVRCDRQCQTLSPQGHTTMRKSLADILPTSTSTIY